MTQIRYDAPPTIGRFLGCDAMVRGLMGPVGSGKSTGCCNEIVRRAVEAPLCIDGKRRSKCVVVRNTYRELQDTTIPTFRDWVPDDRRFGTWRASDAIFEMRFNEVECDVLFRSLDRPDQVKKLLGLELSFAYINEAREVPHAVVKMLITRLGRYPKNDLLPRGVTAWTGLWMDTNPPDTDHWWYRLFEENRPANHALFRQPGGRAPNAENLDHLPRGYYDNICEANKGDPDFCRVMVDGEYGFIRDGKPIYPEYQDSVHCRADVAPLPREPIVVGLDFGLTPAATLWQQDPSDGQWQCFDELVSEDMGAETFGELLSRKLKHEHSGRPVRAWGDPAGDQRAQTDEKTPFDVLRAAGLDASPAPTNDFMLRREAVAHLLKRLTMRGRPALVISDRCRRLRKAMQGGYCYRRLQVSGGDHFADKPDKNMHSHVAESAQYALVGEGEDTRVVGLADIRSKPVTFKARRSFGHG